MKRTIVFICGMLSALCCLPFLTGCGKKEAQTVVERVVAVAVHPVEKRLLRPFVQSVGTLLPNEEVVLSAELDGILKELRVKEGSLVSKGQLLAIIDDADYVLEVKRAESAVRQAEATLAHAKAEFQRKEALYKEQLVTQQQFDDISTRVSLAEAELERAKASLALARQKLSKTRILAPLSGAVKEKKVERGNFVKNGTPLLTVINSDPIKLTFTVTERDLSRLKKNQEVIFTVAAYPAKEFTGKVRTIYPSLAEDTRSLQVEALAPNRDGLLRPGLFAQVVVYTGEERETIVVPATSLLYEGESVRVFVADGERARERVVRIGQQYKLQVTDSASGTRSAGERSADGRHAAGPGKETREFTEVTEGVSPGEQVITVGQQHLFDGAKIGIVSGAAVGNL